MIYHLYQRTITIKNKKVKCWYYWYYDKNKKQVRKSCGKAGNPCLLKREAEAFVSELQVEEKQTVTFNSVCSNMLDDDSLYLKKRKNRGEEYKEQTLYQHRLYLRKFLEKFGDMEVNSVNSADIDNWLICLDYSNSVRNNILAVIREVYKELYVYHYINQLPLLENYKRKTSRIKGIIYPGEIRKLFPSDYDELIKIWHTGYEPELYTYRFATCIYTLLSTGMRSGEVRALQWNQFVRNDAVLINAMIDSNDERINHLKKGNDEEKKWRVVVLPERTALMLSNLKAMSNDEYCFLYKNEVMTTWYLLDHFRRVLAKNGIEWRKRNIGIHSLRFTYDTMLKPQIDNRDLRLMIGHVSEQMTEYYDRSKALDHLDSLLENKETLNNLFN